MSRDECSPFPRTLDGRHIVGDFFPFCGTWNSNIRLSAQAGANSLRMIKAAWLLTVGIAGATCLSHHLHVWQWAVVLLLCAEACRRPRLYSDGWSAYWKMSCSGHVHGGCFLCSPCAAVDQVRVSLVTTCWSCQPLAANNAISMVRGQLNPCWREAGVKGYYWWAGLRLWPSCQKEIGCSGLIGIELLSADVCHPCDTPICLLMLLLDTSYYLSHI